MENAIKNLLVPWDFSEHSYYALQNAIEISKVTGYKIILLHVISKMNDEAASKEKLDTVVAKIGNDFGVNPSYLIKVGTIFNTISEVASDPEFGLAVMKTDGVKGMQRFTGSRAIKIITGSKIPFIVVQQPPQKSTFEKILYPIDYRIENKQILGYISYLTKFYQPKLILLRPKTNDKVFKKNISNTVNFAKVMLDSKNISYEVITAEGKLDYAIEINNIANEKQCDLILIQLEKNLTLTKFLFGVKEQKIIANPYKIPVMCLNPRIELLKYAGFH
jgi:nucleotide-binding universal stress UspA family protein